MSKSVPPESFDESPEWTEEDWVRARPAGDVHGAEFAALLVRPRGRPAMVPQDRRQKVNIRLSPDVLAALRAGGPGWQSRADAMLRAALGLPARG